MSMSPAASIMSEALTSTAWEIVPAGFFSRHFQLQRNGQIVTQLEMGVFREACTFGLGGHEFEIRRVSWWRDQFRLSTGGTPVCEVERAVWSRRFEITAAEERWTLMRAGLFSRDFRLLAGERVIGTIRPVGWFSRRRVADFADTVPPPIQVLSIFLVLIVNRRRQHQSSS